MAQFRTERAFPRSNTRTARPSGTLESARGVTAAPHQCRRLSGQESDGDPRDEESNEMTDVSVMQGGKAGKGYVTASITLGSDLSEEIRRNPRSARSCIGKKLIVILITSCLKCPRVIRIKQVDFD
ncbi:Hypothetical protein NTJ_04495 [Nesidiocoris tenuis]|uniref:Uncharacterized protein n=1 Tax=Nesidiocoris tenuis TaxID=355587 RepID=A0ABN7AMV8_9HEMI|nr:Hypothetical protein NTJ_04495 [Nesidiocoris tenuis]